MNNPYTYARIDLKGLVRNLTSVRKSIRKGTAVMAVVKSDAYGHGIVAVSTTLERAGVNGFGVAFVQEGVVLRKAGISSPIYVLSGFQRGEEDMLIDHNLVPLVYSADQVELLDRESRKRNVQRNIHLKIDTGMGRLGFLYDDMTVLNRVLEKTKNLNITGVATHISDAHDSAYFTKVQIKRFQKAQGFLESRLSRRLISHAANTDTFFNYPESCFDMVRAGISLYGYGRKGLTPVMHVFSKLISVKTLKKGYAISYGRTYRLKKDTVVGVLPVGYADGYSRMLSNKGFVGIKGKKVYVVGRVTMNHTMIDMKGIHARVGDNVLIIGKDGTMYIGADQIASLASTISYELLCSMGSSLKRIYE